MGITSSKSHHAAEIRGQPLKDAKQDQQPEEDTEEEDDDEEDDDDDDDFSTCEGKNAYWHDYDADSSFESRPRIPLTWKGDPEETLSDWKILLHCEDGEEQEKVFHVHRSVLALGERGCDYFATLFQSHFSENQQSTSHIHLKSSFYDVFEHMLSFLYDGKLHMCHHMVLPLRSLARYFGIPALQKQVNIFLAKNLTSETALYYLKAASDWKEESLFQSSLIVCAERFMDLDVSELNNLPLDLFRAIVTCPDLQFCANLYTPDAFCQCDRRLSDIVSKYLKSRLEKIGAQELVVLTDSYLMKRLDPDAATHFLSLVKDLYQGATDEEKMGLKDLCHRCWQCDIPSSQGFIQIAKIYVDNHWDEMDWNGRQLLMQLGHSLRTTEKDAEINSVRVAGLESDLQRVKSEKRLLEMECIDLRRTKRRLLAGEDITDDEDDDDGDY